ncbi:Helicase associated domain protein [Micromonospora sp. LOL_024]|uniref:DEAD/DEAH box helicase n=1 Tax=Micromonospora sp. LOL_024 TaxID=3345412 RepID=UPI003A87A1DB
MRDYQQEAVEAIVSGAADTGRGQMIAACGTGKTLIAVHAAVRLSPRGLVVIVCPTLTLIAQTLRVWRPVDAATLAVCSDETVATVAGYTDELSCPVTAEVGELVAWLRAPHCGRMRVVAVTALSAARVGAALKETGMVADFLIIDEAHRTAGRRDKTFGAVHSDACLPARVRLNMTATPRILMAGRGEAKAYDAVLSMDDPAAFGPVWYRYPFSRAIEEGWLDDYRVVVIGVTSRQALEVLNAATDDDVSSADGAPLRTAVVQTALLRAATEFGLRRVLVFTSRISDSREFARTLPRTAALLPAEHKPKGRLTTGHVDGRQSMAQRQIHLDRLADPPEDGWTVISSAKALTEGVDVPAVDAVVLTRPTESTVQMVQTVGRALRRNPFGSGIATILIPVLLPDDREQLPDTDDEWATAWQVLRAMRAHDEDFAIDLDTRRRHATTGDQEPRLPDRVLVRLPDGYPTERLLRHITIRMLDHTATGLIVRRPYISWDDGIAAARLFRQREGHLNVPRYHQEGDVDLGGFIHTQRGRHRRRQATPDQLRTLEELGITWQVYEARWQRHLAAFTAFYRREGHLQVHRNHREDGINLGTVAHNLRKQRKLGKVPADRIAAMDAMRFPWSLAPTHRRVTRPRSRDTTPVDP